MSAEWDKLDDPPCGGIRMSRASTCSVIRALHDECVTLGMHKSQYPFDDRRVVEQVIRCNALLQHLEERFECR